MPETGHCSACGGLLEFEWIDMGCESVCPLCGQTTVLKPITRKSASKRVRDFWRDKFQTFRAFLGPCVLGVLVVAFGSWKSNQNGDLIGQYILGAAILALFLSLLLFPLCYSEARERGGFWGASALTLLLLSTWSLTVLLITRGHYPSTPYPRSAEAIHLENEIKSGIRAFDPSIPITPAAQCSFCKFGEHQLVSGVLGTRLR